MSSNYSPSRSPAGARLQMGGISRLRSSASKKPPEPLRRAVADSLSITPPGNPSAVASEASRTLRDYLAAHTTTDLAYSVIIEHTLAERERSPAVVARCVAFLKRYLLRYKPSVDTLQQIDQFCVNIITECDLSPNRKLSPWSRTLSQQSRASPVASDVSPLPVSSFASGALIKSLSYIRSLVAQHIPKWSFQPAAFSGSPTVSKSLPTLSSLLSKSFNSQLNTPIVKEPLEHKDGSATSVSDSTISEKVDGMEDVEFIAFDVFTWRWHGHNQFSLLSPESDHLLSSQVISKHNFLEVGAAALLVGDMESMKGKLQRNSGPVELSYLDQLLQPSLLMTVTNSASARAHLKGITALKRSKPGFQQIWLLHSAVKRDTLKDDILLASLCYNMKKVRIPWGVICNGSVSWKHLSSTSTSTLSVSPLQQPLKLNFAEVCDVIAAVCSEASAPMANAMTVSSKLSSNSGKPSIDVAVSVLVKLVIDMYVMDSVSAAPLTLSMLEEILCSPSAASKARAFDLILNLGVHAHLLKPLVVDDASISEEEYSHESYLNQDSQLALHGTRKPDYIKREKTSAVDNFECWILGILFELLLHLVQMEENNESVWASSLSCLLYFVCDRGKICKSRLRGLDIRVIKVLLQVSRNNSWAEIVHCKLICILTNMFYQVPSGSASSCSTPRILAEQVDLIGGIEFIFIELVLAHLMEDRRNLYVVMFDYILYQINETCLAAGVSEYSDDESQPVAMLLTLADAPEALHISVRLGAEGVGDVLRSLTASALSRYANSDRLNMLLEAVIEKFDTLVCSFTHLDKEFYSLKEISKSYDFLESIEDLRNSVGMKAKLSWTTLHSLLHSDRIPYCQNGYIWLGDLLMAEINEEKDAIWSNINKFQHNISLAGVNTYSSSLDVPLSIWIWCGLLKSKNNLTRWGFLYVLDRLLMRCKFLLDENKLQQVPERVHEKSRLEKANAVIDIMSIALSLVAQINETDHLNILQMCFILFSQLCLKVLPSSPMASGDALHDVKGESFCEEPREDTKSKLVGDSGTLMSETASMAALLLRGQAIVPMQLVARVPAAMFYWPLIQLAGAATDNIALGVSVGSKGRGNVSGATSDIRATLLLLLIGKCTADPAAFEDVGGDDFFRELLDDTDSRVAYYSSTFLLKRMMTEEPQRYQRMLSNLVSRAQQSNNEKLLENPYLQMRGILQLLNE